MAVSFIVALFFLGLFLGALARVFFQGRELMTVPGTLTLGLAGSFLGGVIAWLFIGTAAGFMFAAIGAAALLYTRQRFLEHR